MNTLVEQGLAGGEHHIDQWRQRERRDLNIHAPGFDLGDIQDGIDQPKQVVSADQDFIQILDLLLGQDPLALATHNPGEPDDGIQRSTQLVAHVRQEGALGLVGGFGLQASLFFLIEQPGVLNSRADIGRDGAEQALVRLGEATFLKGALYTDHTDGLRASQYRDSKVG